MKRMALQGFVGLIVLLCGMLAYADFILPSGFYVQASGGYGVTKLGGNLRVPYGLGVDTYVNDSDRKGVPVGGVGFGYSFYAPSYVRILLGLGLYHTTDIKGEGLLYFSDVGSVPDIYYHYRVDSTRLMLESKFMLEPAGMEHSLSPYLSAGIGLAQNRMSHFSYRYGPNTDPGDVQFEGYGGYSHTGFAYQVGAGLAYQAAQRFMVTLGYQYVFLGNIRFGKRIGSSVDAPRPNMGDIRMHEAVLGIVYSI